MPYAVQSERFARKELMLRGVLLISILVHVAVQRLYIRWLDGNDYFVIDKGAELLELAWVVLLSVVFIVIAFRHGGSLSTAQRRLCLLAAALMTLAAWFGYAAELECSAASIVILLAVSFFFFFLLFAALSVCPFFFLEKSHAHRHLSPAQLAWLALLLAAILCIHYRPLFPYRVSPDTVNQLEQIRGEIPYNTVHAIGHTIFLKLLLSVWNQLTVVILVQLLGVIALQLLFADWFYSKGISLVCIELVIGLTLLWTADSIYALFVPWKDTPAALCLGLICYGLLRLLDTDRLSVGSAFLVGLALVGASLFRLNGVVASFFCLIVFLVFLARRGQKCQLASLFCGILLPLVFVQAYSARVLKPVSMENGFSIQVFGSGIAAVVKEDTLCPEELSDVEALLPLEWMRSGYNSPKDKTDLLWEHDDAKAIAEREELSIFNNAFVLALGAHKREVIRLYLRLLPRHLPTMVRDVLGSTAIVWMQNSPFFPEQHVFLALLLLILCFRFRIAGKDLLFFLPCVCNTVSIMISTVTNEIRYLLPSFLLFPAFLLFLLQRKKSS